VVFQSIDPTAAATYLERAISMYAYGENHPGLSDIPVYTWGLSGTHYMFCGAAELARATGETAYHDDASFHNADIEEHGYVAGYAQVSDYCRHTMVAHLGDDAALPFWEAAVADYQLSARMTTGELAGLIEYERWGTARHAAAAAFSAALLFQVTGDTDARDFAMSQYNWIKGDNPLGRSFIVGMGPNPVMRPHHRNAFGSDTLFESSDNPQIDNTQPFVHLLHGALAGGPDPLEGPYEDNINNYITNEVALDYNTGLVGMAAFTVASAKK
jgi:endoglucanase